MSLRTFTMAASATGVIPALVAGTHRAASVSVAKARGRAALASTTSADKWAPVKSTGVTPLGLAEDGGLEWDGPAYTSLTG